MKQFDKWEEVMITLRINNRRTFESWDELLEAMKDSVKNKRGDCYFFPQTGDTKFSIRCKCSYGDNFMYGYEEELFFDDDRFDPIMFDEICNPPGDTVRLMKKWCGDISKVWCEDE